MSQQPKKKKSRLHIQIFAAMLLGLLLGLLMKNATASGSAPAWVTIALDLGQALGQIFVRLLKMMIVPLVSTSIVLGVASLGDVRQLGRMGLRTFVYFMATSAISIMIGLSLSNLIRPGANVALPSSISAFSPDSLSKPSSLADIFFRMIPENPVRALVEMDMLAIIFFAICFGMGLTLLDSKKRQWILDPLDAAFQAFMRITDFIIRLAPFGVFGLILVAVFKMNLDYFRSIATYMLTITLGLSIHFFIVLPAIYAFFTKRNPIRHYRDMADSIVTAFSTSSSNATLPVNLDCLEKNAGISNKVSSFVLPLGATINMDGTALYECAGVLFIAQVLGVDLSITQQFLVVITALMASIGAAGIPSAGLVMIFIVLEAVGLKGDQVGLIVGTMLAVDRPLDMFRTVVNTFSDSVGAVVIAQFEGELAD